MTRESNPHEHERKDCCSIYILHALDMQESVAIDTQQPLFMHWNSKPSAPRAFKIKHGFFPL